MKANSSWRPEGALNGLHFYLEMPTKQKQQLNKKINELKGMIRFRLISDQTDYIVVDKDQIDQACKILFDPNF